MPGYHKSYQRGTGKAKKPSTYLDTALTREQMEDRKRMQQKGKSAFFQALPENTPEEARVARKNPSLDLAYDDDAPATMRMVKKNNNGSQMNVSKQYQKGTGNTKGLMALGRSGAKGREAYKNITGKEFKEAKEAGMGMKYRMGTGMADQNMMDYGRMLMERGQKIMAMGANMGQSSDPERGVNEMTMGEKIYQDGTGQMTDAEIMRQEMLAQRRAERGMSPGQRSRMKTLESQEEMGYTPPSGGEYKGALYKMPEIKEIVRSGSMEGIDLERLAATASRGSLPANLRGMIMQYLEEGPGAKAQEINQPVERSVTQTPTQFAFQEGPGGEGGSLTITGRQSDIKKRTMGGRNMYVR